MSDHCAQRSTAQPRHTLRVQRSMRHTTKARSKRCDYSQVSPTLLQSGRFKSAAACCFVFCAYLSSTAAAASSAFMAGRIGQRDESRPSRALDYLQLAAVLIALLPANAQIDNLVHISLGCALSIYATPAATAAAAAATIGSDCSSSSSSVNCDCDVGN